ncbi:MAG: biopolymer transporter ExbD [Pseudomonadales bacterium]|nr:biopolymer transporter ExbD [Pseudomonadales bacterium]
MKFQRRRSPSPAVDLTPLIDVVFLLLIFFMVTTTFVREGRLTLELPEADAPGEQAPPDLVEVVVSVDGDYVVAGQPLGDRQLGTLMAALREAGGEAGQRPPLVIAADGSAPHQAVVTVMDAAGRLGFAQVRIATQPTDASAP